MYVCMYMHMHVDVDVDAHAHACVNRTYTADDE